ncbi:type IV pilus modification PilV family protein [Planococcus sp. YIM B11945]|uniref:type IV pilus modification PilV family protein n=1 Tax=Planococcus sp. YIM B11945 TaxID=3435410 RepID=UPI003D7E2510
MKNEQGFTLVEVLASLVIISILLMSFMAVFANTNKAAVHNSEKLVVINLADAYLERIQASPSEFLGALPPTLTTSACQPLESGKKCKVIPVTPAPTPINGKSYNVIVKVKQSDPDKTLSLLEVVVTVEAVKSKVSSSVEGYVSYGK